jgi:hypothetical protein
MRSDLIQWGRHAEKWDIFELEIEMILSLLCSLQWVVLDKAHHHGDGRNYCSGKILSSRKKKIPIENRVLTSRRIYIVRPPAATSPRDKTDGTGGLLTTASKYA